jgi:hypothetical protein
MQINNSSNAERQNKVLLKKHASKIVGEKGALANLLATDDFDVYR